MAFPTSKLMGKIPTIFNKYSLVLSLKSILNTLVKCPPQGIYFLISFQDQKILRATTDYQIYLEYLLC